MKKNFCNIVEKGRVNSGEFGTPQGDTCGAFFLRCPATGERLKVIVGDGSDWRECDLPGESWEHVSVSCERRCPTWIEMSWVKGLFFEDQECVVQFHPPRKDYINAHDFVLHLWRPSQTPIPMPPKICV